MNPEENQKLDDDQALKLAEISRNEFQTVEHFGLMNTSYHVTWKYRYHKSKLMMKFHTESGKLKKFKYVNADPALSEELIADDIGFKIAVDDVFEILEIPLIGHSHRLVIFLPNERISLKDALKKLDFNRIKKLLDELKVSNIHYHIPHFNTTSTIDTGKLFSLNTSKFHKFCFGWRRPFENQIEENDGFEESFIKRPPDRTPYYFIANRPFLYAVFKYDTIPMIMGVFTGTH